MQIIEIKAQKNGAHNNLTSGYLTAVPEGWAVVPEGMALQNFPFGEVTAEEIDGVMTVTGWVPGVLPEPAPKPETAVTDADMAAAILEGVNGV